MEPKFPTELPKQWQLKGCEGKPFAITEEFAVSAARAQNDVMKSLNASTRTFISSKLTGCDTCLQEIQLLMAFHINFPFLLPWISF